MTKASYEICLNLKLYQTLFLNRGDKITGDPEISRPTYKQGQKHMKYFLQIYNK